MKLRALKIIFLYIFAAWLLLGATFLLPQKYPGSQLTGGADVVAYGFPLQFYATSAGVQAQVSMGFLLLDLFVWFLAVAAAHFLYKNLVRPE